MRILKEFQCSALYYQTNRIMEIFDQYLVFGIVLTDPSSASDCLSHKPLAKKLNTCELEISAVRLVFYYLTNRGQQSKIGCNYSLWKELLF